MRIWWEIRWPLFFAEFLALFIIAVVHVVPSENGGLRFLLIDDAMISMAYARSLAEGCGLVWYCGAERVEGFTNFLWTLYMAFWHFLGFIGDIGSLPILVTGLVTVAFQIYWLYRLGERVGGKEVGRLSAWMGAAFFPLIRWHVSGMETGVLAVLLTYFLYEALRVERRWPWWVLALVGIGFLVRMDFGWWALGIATYVAYRQRRWNLLMEVGGVLLIVGAALTIFRWSYYEELLPQAYYVKVQLVPLLYRVVNGFLSFGKYVYVNLAFFVLAGYALIKYWKHIEVKGVLLVSWIAGFMYNLYAGGDVWEIPPMGSRFLLMGSLSIVPLSALSLKGSGIFIRLAAYGTVLYGIPSLRFSWESMRVAHLYRIFTGSPTERAVGRSFYNVFAPYSDVFQRLVPPGKVVAIPIAGTYPYLYRQYKWLDILGLCTKHERWDTAFCVIYAHSPLLYLPGHTHIGWERALREGDVLFLPPLGCDGEGRKRRPFEWRCTRWAKALFPKACCEDSPSAGKYPNKELQERLCRVFRKDPREGALYWRTSSIP